MRRVSWSISRYLLGSVLPYFISSWVLLSVVLFVQQAGRYSDIFFNANIPRGLILQLAIALIPSVIAFTCPMAALVGVVIGLSKVQSDSELVVMRTAGMGNLAITLPMIVLGFVLSFFALFINVKGVPYAAAVARKVAIQTAIQKLDSPIEPGIFNTGLAGLTVFVREGDSGGGVWRNMYIFNRDSANSQYRLITARIGRVDADGEGSELVLSDAEVTSIPFAGRISSDGVIASEKVGEIRFSVGTGREELIQKMQRVEEGPEALGLGQLALLARESVGKERIEAQILFGRRVILSITPLLFALLGSSLVLRFNRVGRGFGVALALLSLISYYLLTIFGEQVTRSTGISTTVTGLIPIGACLLATGWFYLSNRLLLGAALPRMEYTRLRSFKIGGKLGGSSTLPAAHRLLDNDIVRSILRFFLLTLGFLSAIFMIFTAFDMWRFAWAAEGGVWSLAKYLFFLFPLVYIQVAPPALMIAVLATFVIKSRQNELVTWAAAGRSIYRVLLPCVALMAVLGAFNFLFQEIVLPRSNAEQDSLRSSLRSQGIPKGSAGTSWSASANRIYSFESPETGGRNWEEVKGLLAFEFSQEGRLVTIYSASGAQWKGNQVTLSGAADRFDLIDGVVRRRSGEGMTFQETERPFVSANQRPSHLSLLDAVSHLREVDSQAERRTMQVAVHEKFSTALLPLFIVLFTAPFAISLSRKGKAATVGLAVAAWLVFTGVTNAFEQMGLSGQLPAAGAIWLPLLGFAAMGVILLTRIRT